MDKGNLGAIALYLCFVGSCSYVQRERWEFGRYGMPRTVVAEDGQHYVDGGEVDPLTLWMAQTQYQEEIALSLILSFPVLGLFTAWRQRRNERQHLEACKELAEMYKQMRQRPRADVEPRNHPTPRKPG